MVSQDRQTINQASTVRPAPLIQSEIYLDAPDTGVFVAVSTTNDYDSSGGTRCRKRRATSNDEKRNQEALHGFVEENWMYDK